MHIAGVLVQTRPECVARVSTQLAAIEGLELHATNPDGRLIVTLEGDDRGDVADALGRVHAADHVLSACLVYEQSESENTETST